MERKITAAAASEEVRGLFWEVVNLRDSLRHCGNPGLELLAFRLHALLPELEKLHQVTLNLIELEGEK